MTRNTDEFAEAWDLFVIALREGLLRSRLYRVLWRLAERLDR